MIDANAAIVLERSPEIIPKSEVATLTAMQSSECVRITESEHRPVPGARLRQK
jgi:hypothetical protein